MAEQKSGARRSLRTSVKGPLMFSAFWAVLAFVAVLIYTLLSVMWTALAEYKLCQLMARALERC